MKNIKEFWSNVSKGHRHIVSEMGEKKTNRILNRVTKHLINPISDNLEIKSILDWGCGGGLISKKLCDLGYSVYIVDLINHSLESALEYAPKIKYSQLINNDVDLITYDGPAPDMLLCNEVIQHFPSKVYFDKIFNIWVNVISPNYISIQVKLGKSTQSQKNYEKNYLNGLVLNEDELLTMFNKSDYNLTYKSYENTLLGKPMGYYIFKKI